jgi:hypothetical protein
MKIACIQIDGKLPNLALMKIASYYRSRGDEVIRYLSGDVDKVFISVIWPENKAKAIGISKMINVDCEIGGSGIDINKILPNDVEHSMPAYDLWDIDYSIGFTSRGCTRKCGFCIVPKKEGNIKFNAPISEFLSPNHNKLMLLDNNFLASPNWKENLLKIKDIGLMVTFTQGLDIRLINDENAKLLSEIDYRNGKFHDKYIYFAFDNIKDEETVRNGIKILFNHGFTGRNQFFYMLVGFNTTFKEDLKRYSILWDELGVYPFVMIYNNRRDDKRLRAFARWINRRIHKVCSWDDYSRNPDLVKEVEI